MNIIKPLVTALSAALIVGAFSIAPVLAEHHGGGKNKMEMMDTDGDGSVSKEEFMAHKEEKFNKKDENGDGVLSEDEMAKHCKTRKHGKKGKKGEEEG